MSSSKLDTVAPPLSDKQWVQLHEWVDSTTKAWSKVVKAEAKRQHRCEGMTRLRVLKKNEFQQTKTEREELERQVQQRLGVMNQNSLNLSKSKDTGLCNSIHHLALESDVLRTENTELTGKLRECERFQSLVEGVALDFFPVAPEDNSSCPSVYAASKMSPWVPSSYRHEDGCRVKFPNGEPSFHFHPFTKLEFDEVMRCCEEKYAVRAPVPVAGSLFG